MKKKKKAIPALREGIGDQAGFAVSVKPRNIPVVPILCLLLIVATFISYSSSIKNDFVWDDKSFIVDTPAVKDLSSWREFFTRNIGFSGGARNNFYRPLYSLANAIDYKIGGGRPFTFHITNAALHAACSVLVFLLIFLIFNDISVAFGTAIIFALHPVQTQAVTYIAGRADPMYSFFTLFSLIGFVLYSQKNKSPAIYSISLVSLVFALLSKEAAIITPFLILLYIYTVSRDALISRTRQAMAAAPYFAIVSFYLVLRKTILDFSKISFSTLNVPTPPIYIRSLTACKAVFLYFKFLLLPVGFHMELYLPDARSIMQNEVFAAVVGMVCLIAVILYCRKRDIFFFFGMSWFFIALFPVLNIFPVNAAAAVHWLYLPSIGFFFTVNLILWRLSGRLGSSRGSGKGGVYIFIGSIVVVSLILGALTYEKNKEWKDEETLYNSIIPFAQTPRLYVNLGNAFVQKKEFDKAMLYYARAIQIAPNQTEAYSNMGYIYNTKKEFDKAEVILKKAISLSPGLASAHINLGVAYANTGRYKEALAEIDKALELNPTNKIALNLSAEIYLVLGRPREAKNAFERSLAVDSEQPEIKRRLEAIK